MSQIRIDFIRREFAYLVNDGGLEVSARHKSLFLHSLIPTIIDVELSKLSCADCIGCESHQRYLVLAQTSEIS